MIGKNNGEKEREEIQFPQKMCKKHLMIIFLNSINETGFYNRNKVLCLVIHNPD